MKKKIFIGFMCVCLLLMTACPAAVSTEGKAEPAQTEAAADEAAQEATQEAAGEVDAESTEVESGAAEAEQAVEAEETADVEDTEADENEEEKEIQEDTLTETEEEKKVTEEITAFDQPKTMYATAAVNVRRGPSTEYDVVTHLIMAQQVETTGQAKTGWYQIMVEGQPAYVSNKYLSETVVEIPQPTDQPVEQPAEQAPAQEAQPAQQPTVQPTPQPAAQQIAVAPAGVIMVGDSRCVQMNEAVGGGGCLWICENSKEYTWFVEKAIPNFDKHVGNGTKVVINLGVNDPEHYRQYVETINAKAAEWAQRGAKTYLVSVNPVWENPYTTKEQVDTFNANVPGMLVGVTWIDTHTWLVENGYRVLDGLHYDAPTYVNIFNLIMGSL